MSLGEWDFPLSSWTDVGSLPCLDQWKGLQFFFARTLLICAGVKICSGEAIASFVQEPSEVVKTPGAPWYKWWIWRYLEGLGQQHPIFLQSYFCRGSNQLDFFFRVSCVGHDKSGLLVISAMLGIAGYGFDTQPCWDCFTGSTLPAYGYESIPINTIFRGMNIHLPAIFMFTRGTRFWPTAISILFALALHDIYQSHLLSLFFSNWGDVWRVNTCAFDGGPTWITPYYITYSPGPGSPS